MEVLNIASYKFLPLSDLAELQSAFFNLCEHQALKGTILLSPEGINLSLAGEKTNIRYFQAQLKEDCRFSDMTFRESYSDFVPFKRLKIKIKKEIITFKRPEIQPHQQSASRISPEDFKEWLDSNRDMLILDTRNDYEIHFGTFKNAVHLDLKDFCEFADAVAKLPQNKPIVMFCTGGVRCEKAGLHLLNQGFSEVYQLEGGILNYFSQIGGDYYQGDCFVFDDCVALTPNLSPSEKSKNF